LIEKWDGSTFVVISNAETLKTHTVTGLTMGQAYRFRVKSRNSYGYSVYSNEVSFTSGMIPNQPQAPSTTVSNENVVVSWIAPADNGSPITGYKLLFIKSDGLSYEESTTGCDGSNPTIVLARSCVMPMGLLAASPFNLLQGTSIFVKVIASNYFGDSTASEAGNGGIMV
jgi:hypothetical protein